LGSTITVKHCGVHATGVLRNPIYCIQKSTVESNTSKVFCPYLVDYSGLDKTRQSQTVL
jgi:hypothetical protein